MVEVLEKCCGKVLGFKVKGRFTKEDLDRVEPMFLNIIKEYGHVSFLIDITEFNKVSVSELFNDIKLAIDHKKDIKRISIVGNKFWHTILASASGSIFRGQRYFDKSQMDYAWGWIMEKEECYCEEQF